MQSKAVKIVIFLSIIVAAIVIAAVLTMSRKPPEKAPVEEKAFLVDVSLAQYQDLNFMVKSQGTVEPKIETRLTSQVSGRIASVSDKFIEGGMFEKGDVLIQLEQFDYTTEYKLAEAELARTQAALEEEIARGKVAEQEWRSVKSGPVPELGLRKPQLAKEKANVAAAQAQLERAKRNLERTRISAPYAGIVVSKAVDLGQYVTIGMDLGLIYNTDVAQVRMPLSDNDLAYLNLSASHAPEVQFSAKVAGDFAQWQGRLTRDEGILDNTRRVIYGVAEIADPYLRRADGQQYPLKFGRFVQAQITGQRVQDIIVLPRNVLRLDGTLLLVDQQNKLQIKKVAVQRADENNVYISAGIVAGDRVITSAVPNPYNGMAVRLANEGEEKIQRDKEDTTDTSIASAGEG